MGLMTGNLHLPVPEWVEPEWRDLMEACWEPNSGARPTTSDLLKQLRAIHAQALAQEAEEAARQQRQGAAAAAAAAQEAAPTAPQQQPQTPFAAVWAQPNSQQEQQQVPALSAGPAMQQQEHSPQQVLQEGAGAPVDVLPATPLGPALAAEVRPVAVTPPAHLPMWLRTSSNTSNSSQQQRQHQQLLAAAEPLADSLLLLQQQQSLPGAADLVPLVVPGRLPGLPRLVTPSVTGAGSPSGSTPNGSLRLSTGSQQQQLAHHSSQGCAKQQQHHRAVVGSPTYQQLI